MFMNDTLIDDAYLDNFTVIISPASGVDQDCGNDSWSKTVPQVSTKSIVCSIHSSLLITIICTLDHMHDYRVRHLLVQWQNLDILYL